jgi:hypothetical protein
VSTTPDPLHDICAALDAYSQANSVLRTQLIDNLPDILTGYASLAAHLECVLHTPSELTNEGWRACADGLVKSARRHCVVAGRYGPSSWHESKPQETVHAH